MTALPQKKPKRSLVRPGKFSARRCESRGSSGLAARSRAFGVGSRSLLRLLKYCGRLVWSSAFRRAVHQNRVNAELQTRVESRYGAAIVGSPSRIPTRLRQGYGGQADLAANPSGTDIAPRHSPNPAVALPLNVCRFPRRNIHLKWAEAADSGFSSLQEDFVVTGRHRHAKPPLVVGGK